MTELYLFTEKIFEVTNDNHVWTKTSCDSSFWKRYLNVFEKVHVIARSIKIKNVTNQHKRSDGPSIAFEFLPYYKGPKQFFLVLPQLSQIVKKAVSNDDISIIFRVPSLISALAIPYLHSRKSGYALEVVGDPFDALSKGAVDIFGRKIFQTILSVSMYYICQHAFALSYVTEYGLQKRYPPRDESYSTNYSSIDLDETHFLTKKRKINCKAPVYISIGNLNTLYKGQDILLRSMKKLINEKPMAKLIFVGDGEKKSELINLSKELGIDERVTFLGLLSSGEAIRNALDDADVFVLPSRQEGLPRVMIEAMARRLPCIGSNVGGFPELLTYNWLVEPNDEHALAGKMLAIVSNEKTAASIGDRNWEVVIKYKKTFLEKRRKNFYEKIESHQKQSNEKCNKL